MNLSLLRNWMMRRQLMLKNLRSSLNPEKKSWRCYDKKVKSPWRNFWRAYLQRYLRKGVTKVELKKAMMMMMIHLLKVMLHGKIWWVAKTKASKLLLGQK